MKIIINKSTTVRSIPHHMKECYKSFRKDCPNGALTQDKMTDIYKKLFPRGKAENFCRHAFRAFDADKNGSIDFKEFLYAIHIASAGTPQEQLQFAFKMYDVDGDGRINEGEMSRILSAIYELLGDNDFKPHDTPEERTKIIFSQMDNNGDGYLTEEEFIQGCLKDMEVSNLMSPQLL